MTEPLIDKARELREQGWSLRKIAIEVGIPLTQLFRKLQGSNDAPSEIELAEAESSLSTEARKKPDEMTTRDLQAVLDSTERWISESARRLEALTPEIARASIAGTDTPEIQALLDQQHSLTKEQEVARLRVGELHKLLLKAERREASERRDVLIAKFDSAVAENRKFLNDWNTHLEALRKLHLLSKTQRFEFAALRDEVEYLTAYYCLESVPLPFFDKPDLPTIEHWAADAVRWFTYPTPTEWGRKLLGFQMNKSKSPFTQDTAETKQ